MTLSGADAPALPKGELYEWVRYRLPFKISSAFKEKLDEKMQKAPPSGELATP